MNGSKAKALRRLAQETTVGLPNVEYNEQKYIRFLHSDPLVDNGLPVKRYKPAAKTMAPCTRKMYKKMKRIAKQNPQAEVTNAAHA